MFTLSDGDVSEIKSLSEKFSIEIVNWSVDYHDEIELYVLSITYKE